MNKLLLALPLAFAPAAFAASPEEGRVQEALDAVDATPEQREDVRAILDRAIPEMKAFREEGQALREDLRQIFHTSEQIDRAALEEVRVDLVDLFDRATATAFGHLADLSEVFTVEQRQELHQLREQRRQAWRDRWTRSEG